MWEAVRPAKGHKSRDFPSNSSQHAGLPHRGNEGHTVSPTGRARERERLCDLIKVYLTFCNCGVVTLMLQREYGVFCMRWNCLNFKQTWDWYNVASDYDKMRLRNVLRIFLIYLPLINQTRALTRRLLFKKSHWTDTSYVTLRHKRLFCSEPLGDTVHLSVDTLGLGAHVLLALQVF